MNDLISRKTLYKTLHNGGFVGNPDDVGAVLNWVDQCIENVPAVSSGNFRINNFLSPCPFCGSEAYLKMSDYGIAVACSKCIMATPYKTDYEADKDGYESAVDEVISVWNKRRT